MTIRCKGNVLKTFESVGSMHIGVGVAFYYAKMFEPRMLGRVAACVCLCVFIMGNGRSFDLLGPTQDHESRRIRPPRVDPHPAVEAL